MGCAGPLQRSTQPGGRGKIDAIETKYVLTLLLYVVDNELLFMTRPPMKFLHPTFFTCTESSMSVKYPTNPFAPSLVRCTALHRCFTSSKPLKKLLEGILLGGELAGRQAYLPLGTKVWTDLPHPLLLLVHSVHRRATFLHSTETMGLLRTARIRNRVTLIGHFIAAHVEAIKYNPCIDES